jgi:hypothetical protein
LKSFVWSGYQSTIIPFQQSLKPVLAGLVNVKIASQRPNLQNFKFGESQPSSSSKNQQSCLRPALSTWLVGLVLA